MLFRLLSILAMTAGLGFAQEPIISKVEPPYWWTGMKIGQKSRSSCHRFYGFSQIKKGEIGEWERMNDEEEKDSKRRWTQMNADGDTDYTD